jgi:hypothetical protein
MIISTIAQTHQPTSFEHQEFFKYWHAAFHLNDL